MSYSKIRERLVLYHEQALSADPMSDFNRTIDAEEIGAFEKRVAFRAAREAWRPNDRSRHSGEIRYEHMLLWLLYRTEHDVG